MTDMNFLFAVIMAGCGVYCLYLWGKIHFGGQIPDSCMLVPREATMAQCIDAEEFAGYIMPRFLIFGAVILIFGIFGLADHYFGLLDMWTGALSAGMRLLVMEIVTCIVPLLVVIWFAVCLKKIHKRLW